MFFSNNFAKACLKVREAVYGIKAYSQINQNQINISTGTAFMIAPGIIVTVAHVLHVNNDIRQPRHSIFQVIRVPEVGQQMEQCTFIEEDIERDVALMKIERSRSVNCVKFERKIVTKGTACGSVGFPLAFIDDGGIFRLVERFQGANVSSFHTQIARSGRQFSFYETDALMYKGSSGCPGFLSNAKVYGMHNASIIDIERPSSTKEDSKKQETRLAISLWVPAADIIDFAKNNGVITTRKIILVNKIIADLVRKFPPSVQKKQRVLKTSQIKSRKFN